jgi:hypothetical protein
MAAHVADAIEDFSPCRLEIDLKPRSPVRM